MTDAQDTIELPAFGLTLVRYEAQGAEWYRIGGFGDRVVASLDCGGYRYIGVHIRRGYVDVTYSTAASTFDEVCERLLAQMTPDDVAAIRALGER